ncbi:hypothetical protein [Paenibacillus protaetiae]|uniref:hypothetical protein n=1 Tax=Paenibacillus protaetiae TaxID=2509456 RepID=UPI001FC90E4C|nr:hypothetical protein [Paenibacillus protaetiae]
MSLFPSLPEPKLLKRLAHPMKKIRLVLDTDTYNEIDDQFAVIYAANSPDDLQIEAFYAAPFFNELSSSPQDGMEKSYNELHKIQALLGSDIPVYRVRILICQDRTRLSSVRRPSI